MPSSSMVPSAVSQWERRVAQKLLFNDLACTNVMVGVLVRDLCGGKEAEAEKGRSQNRL